MQPYPPVGAQPYPPMPHYSAAYGYPGAPGPAPGLLYARFWRRFSGYILDALIFGLPVGLLAWPLIWGPFISAVRSSVTVDPSGVTHVASVNLLDVVPTSTLLLVSLIETVVALAYFGVLVSLWGHTVGQAALGMRVVRQEDPTRRLPLERGLIRAIPWWGGAAVGFVPYLGSLAGLLTFLALLWVAWDPYKQGLHDKLARSIVIRDDPNGLPAPYGYGYPPSGQLPPGYGYPPGQPPPGYRYPAPGQPPPGYGYPPAPAGPGYPPQTPAGYGPWPPGTSPPPPAS